MTCGAPTLIVDGNNVIITGYGGGTKAITVSKQGDVFRRRKPEQSDWGRRSTRGAAGWLLYGLSSTGALFCMNAKDGKTAWTGPQMGAAGGGGGGGGGRGMGRAPNFGAIVDAGSVLIALPSSGEMIAFKPSEKAYEEVAKIKVSDATYAHPILTGNKVIVKDQQSVAMLGFE